MLFQLSSHYRNCDQIFKDMPRIEKLINAHTDGLHFMSCDRKTLNALFSVSEHFSNTQVGCLNNIKDNYSFLWSLVDKVAFFVRLYPSDAIDNAPSSRGVWPLDISVLDDPRTLHEFRLLVENADTDGIYFQNVARCFARKSGFPSRIDFQRMHGGGSSLATVYGQVSREPQPTLCLVDSDKNSPFSALGSTARAVKKKIGKEKFKYITCIILHAREAENLVPISVAQDIYDGDSACQQTLDVYAKLDDIGRKANKFKNGSEPIRFLDWKNGLKKVT